MRQNSDVHQGVVAELLKVAGVEADYAGLDEYARIALLRRELANNRPLGPPFFEYSERTASELAIVHAAAAAPRIRSEAHTTDLQSLMRNSYAVLCFKQTPNNPITNAHAYSCYTHTSDDTSSSLSH